MSDAIRFILDGNIHSIDGVKPTLTILDYVRQQLGRTGAKEGCREGDCGADIRAPTARREDDHGKKRRHRHDERHGPSRIGGRGCCSVFGGPEAA